MRKVASTKKVKANDTFSIKVLVQGYPKLGGWRLRMQRNRLPSYGGQSNCSNITKDRGSVSGLSNTELEQHPRGGCSNPAKLVTMQAQETRWDQFTRIKRNLFLSFLSLFVVWLPLDSWLRVHPAYSFLSWSALIMLGAFGYYFQRYVHWQCPRCSHSFQQSTEWTFYGPWTVWPRKKCANCGLGLRENPTPARTPPP